ncbi:hypothetical protein FHS23_002171 [Prauserella isguenensis]|uniref:Uncharacterized protein n=1 Tax=Prauserella isguenensis TaxID=1470180 RepID=A0A839RZZ9_9PSEU|nr:hypothetical protein [Prauserella isguenensis]MBB3051148.1 hypothetical protein [Prauserella isguenensis]
MTHKSARDQLDLFGNSTGGGLAPVTQSSRQCPPTRGRTRKTPSAAASVAKDVLAEVQLGQFGLLDDTDTVVVIDPEGHMKTALDGDLVHHLITQKYVQRCPARDTFTGRTGRGNRPVLPLRLTISGRRMLQKWSALGPVGDGR